MFWFCVFFDTLVLIAIEKASTLQCLAQFENIDSYTAWCASPEMCCWCIPHVAIPPGRETFLLSQTGLQRCKRSKPLTSFRTAGVSVFRLLASRRVSLPLDGNQSFPAEKHGFPKAAWLTQGSLSPFKSSSLPDSPLPVASLPPWFPGQQMGSLGTAGQPCSRVVPNVPCADPKSIVGVCAGRRSVEGASGSEWVKTVGWDTNLL